VTRQAVEAALRTAFPERTVRDVTAVEARPGNATACVTFADGDVAYVKTPTDGVRDRLRREAAATAYAHAHCDCRAPEVVAADPDGDPPFLATAPLAGESVLARREDAPLEAEADLLRTVGRGLAGVHAAEFDAPGRIQGGDADGLALAGDGWTDVLCATVRAQEADLFADRFADLPDRLVAALRDAEPLLEGAPAALVHQDLNVSNCLLGDPPGFLDWERALVGDPAFDLADAEGHLVDRADLDDAERDVLREALFDGYRDAAGELPAGVETRWPAYRAVAFLLTPQTFELWADDASEPRDELAAWVREAFDARLTALSDAT
jgi:aminoglycoside phosphotransferase (APT) family kinase protein